MENTNNNKSNSLNISDKSKAFRDALRKEAHSFTPSQDFFTSRNSEKSVKEYLTSTIEYDER